MRYYQNDENGNSYYVPHWRYYRYVKDGVRIFGCYANNITEADKKLEWELGINPVKTPSVGVAIYFSS